MWKVRELADKVTNVVMNYTEVEAKVREATNDDAWGPTGALMQEVAQATFTFEHFPEVMTMLWKRMLQDNKKNWRRTYKSLLLLNYLVRNGSERVVTSSREHIYDLRGLENYVYVDEFGKDQGINIRHKVKELIDFIQDDDKLREERKKAKKNKDKYVGLSSDAMGMRGEKWDTGGRWGKEEYDWGESERKKDEFDNSDEGDSDIDTGNHHTGNGRISGREYRDTENNSGPSLGSVTTAKIKPTFSSPKKPSTPTRKIDLGAATNFGKGENPSPSKSINQPSQQPVDSLIGDTLKDDLFNPRDEAGGEFGDFANAFPPPESKKEVKDDFADFTSAFNPDSTPQPVASPPTSLISSPSMHITNGGSSSTTKSNADLLMGLADVGGMPSVGGPAPTPNLFASSQANANLQHSNPLDDFVSPLTSNSNMGGILQPTSLNTPQPPTFQSSNNSSQQVGSTWSNLNIDLDALNLAGNKNKNKGSAPTMNQLANNNVSSPTFPISSPPGNFMSPVQQPPSAFQFAAFK